MAKIDYRKLKALTDEILALLAEDSNLPADSGKSSDPVDELCKQIKKELQEFRQSLIKGISNRTVSDGGPSTDSGKNIVPAAVQTDPNIKGELKKQNLPVVAVAEQKLPEKKLVEKIAVEALSNHEPFWRTPLVRGFVLCIGLPLITIFACARYLDSRSAVESIKSGVAYKNAAISKSISSDFPIVAGKKKAAEDAFEKGNLELAKNNRLAAAEYFRLALSIDPTNELYLAAFKKASGK